METCVNGDFHGLHCVHVNACTIASDIDGGPLTLAGDACVMIASGPCHPRLGSDPTSGLERYN